MSDDVKPDHLGHRDRLRQRARLGGLSALADYELLELYLFRVYPRADVKPIAKRLIARFGSLSGALGASVDELCAVEGVGEAAALELKIVQEAATRMARAPLARRVAIASSAALFDYVRVTLQYEAREAFHVLFLDKKNQLIADETLSQGTVDQAPVYPREVARRALELAASAVILVHNHPSGDPTPSRADIEITRDVVRAAGALKIAVHDHLVVGRDGVASFKALGLI